MVLRVINVPAPAAGADWSYTVPGQWLLDVVSVSATLVTGTAVTTLPDETGNGHTATIVDNVYELGAPGPYAGGAANRSVFHTRASNPLNENFAATTNDAAFGSATLSVDGWWFSLATATGFVQGDFWGLVAGVSTQLFSAYGSTSDVANVNLDIQAGGAGSEVLKPFFAHGAWHHCGWSWDGANWRVYLDGVLVLTTPLRPPLGRGSPCHMEFPGDHGGGTWFGYCAGVAYYGAALTGAQFAAHAAASSSAAAYKAAVLADAPSAYWSLGTVVSGPSRVVTLAITDGTTTVVTYPGGTTTGTASSFLYTWATAAAGIAQTPDASVNLVRIPRLRLPGGYVLKSSTPDLAVTDQWSNIAIWWDDGALGPGGPIGPYEYPPGALLKFRQTRG